MYSNPPPGRSVNFAVTVKLSPQSGWPFHTAVTTLPLVDTESDFIWPCGTETVGTNARSEPVPPDDFAFFAGRHSPRPRVKPTRTPSTGTVVSAAGESSAAAMEDSAKTVILI